MKGTNVTSLLVTQAGITDGSTADILIQDGVIAKIAPAIEQPPDVPVVQASGRKAYPGFVDGHSHMDKTLVGMPWYHRPVGRGLLKMIADEREMRASDAWDYERQISRQVRIMLANGTLFTRAFVDIDTDTKLTGFEAMLAIREKYAGLLDMRIVAFGQSGTHIRPGTEELIEKAVAGGADIIGGMDPCLVERDPVKHVNWLFSLAEKYGKGIDVHLHERGHMGAFSAELILDRVRATGMQGRVMLSHPHFLGDIPPEHASALIAEMAELQVAATNNAPSKDPKADLVQMLDAGVVVTAGCDGICDTWAPMNHSDMLFKGYELAWRYGLTADEQLARVLDVITVQGAKAMGLTGYGIAEGAPADMVLLDVNVHVEGIVSLPADRLVIRGGRVIADGGKCLV